VDSFVPGTGGIVNRMRQQVCVWWKMTGTDEFGAPVFEAPVEITCRWEWKRMKVVMPRYETFTSKAKVYVERPIEVGDYLYLGSLSEIAGETDPRVIKDAVRVKKYGEISNLRGQADRVLRYANA
jgi:hypothetical protein